MRVLFALILSASWLAIGLPGYAQTDAPVSRETIQTPSWEFTFERGLPTKETVGLMYNALDFQRAVEGYIWATPMVHYDEWRRQMKEQLGLDYGDVAIWDNFCDPKTVGLTPNSTTIYAATHLDSAVGPIVIESPPGALGMIDDIWQRPICDVGPFGPDKGEGGKFLVLPPDFEGDAPSDGYFVVRSPSRVFGYLVRGLVSSRDDVKAAGENLRKVRIYPLSQKDNPPEMKFLSVSGKPLNLLPPTDFRYWERVAEIINREPVHERDRLILGMLAPLGIEKGKPFEPNERQKQILTKAAAMGNVMCQTIGFAKRSGEYVPGSKWGFMITMNADQRAEHYDQIDERTDYTYQGIWVGEGMIKKLIGKGSQYIGAYSDPDDEWFDGGKNYTLHVPAKVPAERFWSVTVYDSLTRSQIVNGGLKPAVGSYSGLEFNADGSVEIYFGPKAPKGKEKNWIQTVPGKSWFVFFRLYGPTEAFFDRSWVLPNVEKQ